jgi:hypothetical protein
MKSPFFPLLSSCFLLALAASLAAQAAESIPVLPLPEGTRIEASFATEGGRGPETLFDGNPATSMIGGGNTAPSETTPVSVFLRFPQPVRGLGGVETGDSDPNHNYYPMEMEFWADSNGDGRFDTKLGGAQGLGPGAKSAGQHLFDGRLDAVHGLEIRVVRQSSKALKRAYQMSHMKLLESTDMPLVAATPNSHKKLFFTRPLPEDTTIRANFATEEGKGPEVLLDGDPSTMMQPRQGTAEKGKSSSLFMRFPEPQENMAGLVLGRSDPHQNYVWLTMEMWADTNGDGQYDTLAGTFQGGSAGEKRFPQALPEVHGLELRVTEQKISGPRRAFILNDFGGMVLLDDPGDTVMHYVVEDFEDFGSWRTWGVNTAQPEGERLYGANLWLSGLLDPEQAYEGAGVGQFRYWFKDNKEPKRLWAKRGVVSEEEAIIDEIRFWANPQGYRSTISFELLDAGGRKFRTAGAELEGDEWKEYVIRLDAETIPSLPNLTLPFRIEHIFFSGEEGGKGDVLLDNITLVGAVDRTKRIQIKRVYEGLSHDPDKPLTVTYRVRNTLDREITIPLVSELFSSFDPQFGKPVVERKQEVKLPPHGFVDVPVEFGEVGAGHYLARLSVRDTGIEVTHLDPVAVTRLNGGRINTSPMWFGSMHPGDWLARPENEFVFREVVIPLGLDAYRTSAPDELLIKGNILAAAGFGFMPPHLRKPGEENTHKGAPNDYEAYYEWVKKEAREKYLPHAERILSVEFYNEPDLPDFEFIPGIDEYLKMHEVFRRAFREVIPGIKIGTGGNTVFHGREKKDFNPRMYRELAKEADVAIWHAHGPLDNYISRHRQVESWLAEGGRPPEEALLGNSEAGEPSGSDPVRWLHQADNLVKKVGWAKSQSNSYFYIWFTTTDTYDPQGGYLGGENWGLINYRQRLKPSGQAYNELIRQLANTKGQGEVRLDSRLMSLHFERDNGGQLWLIWPQERGARFLQPLLASGPVEVTDMFGRTEVLTPVNGRINIEVQGYPLYLSGAADLTLEPATGVPYLAYERSLNGVPGETVPLPLTLKNIWDQPVIFQVEVLDPEGQVIVTESATVAPGESSLLEASLALPATLDWGSHGYSLRINSAEADISGDILPLSVVAAHRVPKGGPFTLDGKPKTIPGAMTIVLDKESDVHDLSFDPSTAYWAGPEDLSATLQWAHDGKGIYLSVTVKDQAHFPGEPGAGLWNGDSIQLGISAGGKTTQVGLTEAGDGYGWCWVSPIAGEAGRELKTPFQVTREGSTTFYELYLPFEALDFAYEPGMALRAAFVVNESDKEGGRVRALRWHDGILAGGGVDRYGHLVLE